MPRWMDTPPKGSDHPSFRIVRTPADKPITAIVTSEEIVGCTTNFVQNRTIPCEGPDTCEHCAAGHSWRWHGYLSAMLTTTHEHILFEFTAPPSDTFRNYLLRYKTLRGCVFTARRPSGRPNGRVVVTCKYVAPTDLRIPARPNIRNILCRVWNLQTERVSDCPASRPPIKNTAVKPSNSDGRVHSPARTEPR